MPARSTYIYVVLVNDVLTAAFTVKYAMEAGVRHMIDSGIEEHLISVYRVRDGYWRGTTVERIKP